MCSHILNKLVEVQKPGMYDYIRIYHYFLLPLNPYCHCSGVLVVPTKITMGP